MFPTHNHIHLHAENLAVVPTNVDDKGLLSAYEEGKSAYMVARRIRCDYVDMREEGGRTRLDAAKNRGRQEAEAKAEKEKAQTIMEMYADGIKVEKIAKFFKKTEVEIQEILSKHK